MKYIALQSHNGSFGEFEIDQAFTEQDIARTPVLKAACDAGLIQPVDPPEPVVRAESVVSVPDEEDDDEDCEQCDLWGELFDGED